LYRVKVKVRGEGSTFSRWHTLRRKFSCGFRRLGVGFGVGVGVGVGLDVECPRVVRFKYFGKKTLTILEKKVLDILNNRNFCFETARKNYDGQKVDSKLYIRLLFVDNGCLLSLFYGGVSLSSSHKLQKPTAPFVFRGQKLTARHLSLEETFLVALQLYYYILYLYFSCTTTSSVYTIHCMYIFRDEGHFSVRKTRCDCTQKKQEFGSVTHITSEVVHTQQVKM
jgi:hypothetical protein